MCIYESLRLAFLVGAFLLLQPQGEVSFPWLALVAAGAMFLLMALILAGNFSGGRFSAFGFLGAFRNALLDWMFGVFGLL